MVSVLDSGVSDPGFFFFFGGGGVGWCCVVFLGKIITLTVSPFTQVYKWVPVDLMLGGGANPGMD